MGCQSLWELSGNAKLMFSLLSISIALIITTMILPQWYKFKGYTIDLFQNHQNQDDTKLSILRFFFTHRYHFSEFKRRLANWRGDLRQSYLHPFGCNHRELLWRQNRFLWFNLNPFGNVQLWGYMWKCEATDGKQFRQFLYKLVYLDRLLNPSFHFHFSQPLSRHMRALHHFKNWTNIRKNPQSFKILKRRTLYPFVSAILHSGFYIFHDFSVHSCKPCECDGSEVGDWSDYDDILFQLASTYLCVLLDTVQTEDHRQRVGWVRGR